MKRTLGLGFLFFFLGILVPVILLMGLSPNAVKGLGALGMAVALIALFRPIPTLGLGHRGVSTGVCYIAFMTFLIAGGQQDQLLEQERLAVLRDTDPVRYLAELKTSDRGEWLEELKVLDPEAYQEEMAKAAVAEEAKKKAEAARKRKELVAEVAKRCKSSHAEIRAYVMAQSYVSQRLHSPSTADFPYINDVKVFSTGTCSFEISGYLDAQNAFGAIIRSYYRAKLTRDAKDDDRWRLDRLSFQN